MTRDEYNRDGVEKLKKLAKEQFDADIESVIRCKDCKKWNTIVDRNKAEYGLCQIKSQLESTGRNDFCSKGEMKVLYTDEFVMAVPEDKWVDAKTIAATKGNVIHGQIVINKKEYKEAIGKMKKKIEEVYGAEGPLEIK